MKPRPVYENDNIFITRRVRAGQFRLLPVKETNQIVKYLLAVLAERHHIELNAAMVMSNHWHSVAHDELANEPDFTHDFHEFTTLALNREYGDRGSMWESRQTNVVRLEGQEDVLGKIAYTVANPVCAGLTRSHEDWPGVAMSWPDKPEVVKRPDCKFFNKKRKDANGKPYWPEFATLAMHRPRGFEDLPDNELAILLRDRIKQAEHEGRAAVTADGRRFMSRRRVLQQSRYACPSKEPDRGGITPTLACRDRQRRIERLEANRCWYAAYCASLKEWRAGNRQVVFPYGTYKMLRVHNARVAPRPGDWGGARSFGALDPPGSTLAI